MDRVADYESVGCRFESCLPHLLKNRFKRFFCFFGVFLMLPDCVYL